MGKATGPKPELSEKGVKVALTIEELANSLQPPRVILLYVPAEPTVDEVIEELIPHLNKGDVIADGGKFLLQGFP